MKDYYFNVATPDDDIGHSTNVGDCAHASAPSSKLYAVRSNDEGMQWLRDNKDKYDVINVSLASTRDWFERLADLNKIIVSASGNWGDEHEVTFPARDPYTIAIGAWWWRHENEDGGAVASYSNGGPNLDAVAPTGIEVMTDDGDTMSFSGTSAASPYATGMLACWIQWRKEHNLPVPTLEEARTFIHENCKDVDEEGFENKSGHGLFVMPSVESLEKNLPETEPEPSPEPETNPDDEGGNDNVAQTKVIYQEEVVKTTVQNTEVDAVIQDGTTYVPIREVAELLGLEVTYDNETKNTVLKKAD